jgi:mannose-6-phosphate isomerase-like protein (cupin superfamily)
MPYASINFAEKFGRFGERWAPKIFIVLDGEMTIHLRDGDVALRAGEMFVVPRGVEHKPSAIRECRMMLIEPAGTVNTGDAQSDRTAEDGVWV